MSPSPTAPNTDIYTLHTTLTTQATTLLRELTQFHAYLSAQTPSTIPVHPDALLGKFRVDVQRELRHLLRYSEDVKSDGVDAAEEEREGDAKGEDYMGRGARNVDLDGIHRVRSSNVTFLADVWEGVKRSSGVVGVRKVVRYVPVVIGGTGGRVSRSTGGSGLGLGPGSDMVAQTADGRESIGISNESGGTREVGVRGVSKKMNREARERAKSERKGQRSIQNGDHGRRQEPGQNQWDDSRLWNGDDHTTEPVNANATNKTGNANATCSVTRTTTDQPETSRSSKPLHSPTIRNAPTHTQRTEKESVTIDIIADHGQTWIKMFTKNERWLMMDLAKEGIVDVDDESSGDDAGQEANDEDERRSNGTFAAVNDVNGTQTWRAVERNKAMEELKLIKMAREFLAASRTVRVGNGHRHPKVEFWLSKISRGFSRDADRVLEYLAGTGVVVRTMDELAREAEEEGSKVSIGGEDEDVVGVVGQEGIDSELLGRFKRMTSLPSPAPITDTLNVDCTVLIALISDVSHCRQSEVTIPTHYKGSARRDIEVQLHTDIEDPLLPTHIYPVLRGRKLVCTRKATEHWRNIVGTMGSPTEAARCRLFLGEADDAGPQGPSARADLQMLSIHEIPSDLQLPLSVVEFNLEDMDVEQNENTCSQVEIDVMRKLAKEPRLSSLNSSVFFHGWYRGLTTVSLNRVISEWLNRAINVVLNDLELSQGMTSDIAEMMGFGGTSPLICGRERSLLGSEK